MLWIVSNFTSNNTRTEMKNFDIWEFVPPVMIFGVFLLLVSAPIVGVIEYSND
jgi:hypothetical protein